MAAPGEADFKSNVLLRDEKGFFGVPFKHIITAFMSGVLSYTLLKVALGMVAVPLGLGIAILSIVLVSARGGIPRWQRMVYRVRGSLISAMLDAPDSFQASIGKFFELHTNSLLLSEADIFKPAETLNAANQVDWSSWIISDPRAAKQGDGLHIVDGPARLKLETRRK